MTGACGQCHILINDEVDGKLDSHTLEQQSMATRKTRLPAITKEFGPHIHDHITEHTITRCFLTWKKEGRLVADRERDIKEACDLCTHAMRGEPSIHSFSVLPF